MSQNRTLVCWIGHTDLASMASEVGGKIAKSVTTAINRDIRPEDDGGPIRALLSTESFDSIHFLSGYPAEIEKAFQKWLGQEMTFHKPAKIKSPTDHESIFLAADKFLAKLYKSPKTLPTELCVHLSPGTPAMSAVWILLGTSKYRAKFFQAFQGKSSETRIPFSLDLHIKDVISKADSAFEHLRAQNPEDLEGFGEMTGSSPEMKEAVGRAHRVALRDVSVLLIGESGTGKSKIAEAIHKASRRKNQPFKSINCAALPEQLLESELFGHAQGAFTGADKDKVGIFEEADGGTVFLDEIGECNLGLQAKLLTVLQPLIEKGPSMRKFRRVGRNEDIETDVRIIAATNQNLIQMVKLKTFRLDLYYRLAAITIKLPALRDRADDVIDLANEFLSQINNDFSRDDDYQPKKLSKDALSLIRDHDWPGNARQLYNAILQAVVMSNAETVKAIELSAAIEESPVEQEKSLLEKPLGNGFDLTDLLDFIRKHYLQRSIQEANGVKSKAADLLGYSRQTFTNHLKEFDLD